MPQDEQQAIDALMEGLTQGQQEAMRALVAGKNVFLSGYAGTGKSFVLDRYLAYLEESHTDRIAMAPTGVAALQLRGGTTIHRALKMPVGFTDPNAPIQSVPKTLKAAQVIVIDEVSMVRIDLFERVMKMIYRAEQESMPKQVVLVGDFFQLPPVVTDKDRDMLLAFYPGNHGGWPFMSRYWEGFSFEPHILKEVVRQSDPELVGMLNRARRGDTECVSYFNQHSRSSREYCPDDAIFLCPSNRLAKNINDEHLEALDEKIHTFYATREGEVKDSDMRLVEQELRLAKGARVMSLVNDPEDKYVNGSMGYVARFTDDGSVVVDFDNGRRCAIEPKTWEIERPAIVAGVDEFGKPVERIENEKIGKFTQMPLKLAYAVTIHKSQGLTFDKVVVGTNVFAPGQLYVALSRCTSADGLTVTPKIEERRLRANREVVEFYAALERWLKSDGNIVSVEMPKRYEQAVLDLIESLRLQEQAELAKAAELDPEALPDAELPAEE